LNSINNYTISLNKTGQIVNCTYLNCVNNSKIAEVYMGIIISQPLVNSFKIYNKGNNLLDIKPMNDLPEGKLFYIDKK
jgi:hypothetical protein